MHRSVAQPCSFTILFDVPNKQGDDYYYDDDNPTDSSTYYSSSSFSCSSPVDCTLSLGTASTRNQAAARKSPQRATATTTCLPSFRWDIFSQSNTKTASSAANRPASGSLTGSGGDPLLARRCANCDTTSTPLWRNGPRGPKSLCNACGIRYKKEERRAAPTVAAADPHKAHQGGMGCHDGHPWGYAASSQRSSSMSSGGEFRFAHGYDSNGDSTDDGTLPYLSWCLNVPQPRAEYLHHY